MHCLWRLAIAGTIMLGGCATSHPATMPGGAAERVGIAVGPCFGTCPVYRVELGPDGTGRFTGKQHVAVSGERAIRVDIAAQRDLLAALAPFRPATGTTADTRCDQNVSDQPTYAITWTAADGRITTLNHDLGCRSLANEGLNAVLTRLPDTLRLRPFIGR